MDRSERRYRLKVKQTQRIKIWKCKFSRFGNKDLENENVLKGSLKDNNWSCGCWLCKPWKHSKRSKDKYKVSELRKLDNGKIDI